MATYFISFNSADAANAAFIAQTIKDENHEVRFAGWEVAPGHDIFDWMQDAMQAADHMIGVCSPDYLKPDAVYSGMERSAAMWADPTGRKRGLILFKIRECTLPVIFGPRAYVSLIGVDQAEVTRRIRDGLRNPGPPAVAPTWTPSPAAPPATPAPEPSYLARVVSPEIALSRSVVGREAEVAQLHEVLKTGATT
ncbi:MAG: toll/interleukin-1 receptor domain-containing protein, partial [Pseudomonadota bacterium]